MRWSASRFEGSALEAVVRRATKAFNGPARPRVADRGLSRAAGDRGGEGDARWWSSSRGARKVKGTIEFQDSTDTNPDAANSAWWEMFMATVGGLAMTNGVGLLQRSDGDRGAAGLVTHKIRGCC